MAKALSRIELFNLGTKLRRGITRAELLDYIDGTMGLLIAHTKAMNTQWVVQGISFQSHYAGR